MRLVTILLVMTMLSACGATVPEQTDSAQIPAVADLDRIASGSQKFRDCIFKTDDVVYEERINGLNLTDGWLIEPSDDEPDYVILRIPFEEGLEQKKWTEANADTIYDFTGNCYAAVADYATGRWRWQDCSEDWYSPGDHQRIGVPMDETCNPWSPAGYCYIVVLSWGSESSVYADNFAGISWQGI